MGSPAKPIPVLGLTFLVIGLTFALPAMLVPDHIVTGVSPYWTPEVANVYACAAWAGWAHFIFAFRGQGIGLYRLQGASRLILYALVVIATGLILTGARSIVGPALFGSVVWIYFIDHFLKAEETFEGRTGSMRWLTSYQPLIAFTWLTIVLTNVGNVIAQPWLIWGISSIMACLFLLMGGWSALSEGQARSPLIALFFIAEALVWGTVGRQSGPVFLAGVYVFHIAAGSYIHYFGSYFFAASRATGKDRWLTPFAVIAINAVVIALGFFTARTEALAWLTPILGVQWFTLWVALHLVSSDLFPLVKRLSFSKAK